MFSRDQLKRAANLTEEDFVQLGKCRRPHNRLGFAYQVGFVRLFGRFPQQQPFELFEELVCFSAAQFSTDGGGVLGSDGVIRWPLKAVVAGATGRVHLNLKAFQYARSTRSAVAGSFTRWRRPPSDLVDPARGASVSYSLVVSKR